jgi:P-type Ca2+ transporter type 2A
MGFVWWFTSFEQGPRIAFRQLRQYDKCETERFVMSNGFDCSLFHGNYQGASTVSLSILVFIEMLNAFNALSENESLFDVVPWTNRYLLMAVSCSVSLHLIIVNVPYFAAIFNVKHMSLDEWSAVLWFSAPVILIDEALKYCTRRLLHNSTGAKGVANMVMPVFQATVRSSREEEKAAEDKLV